MKLILVMAIIIPLLNIKNADISEITDGISNGFKTYSKENDNVSQALYNTSDKKMSVPIRKGNRYKEKRSGARGRNKRPQKYRRKKQ